MSTMPRASEYQRRPRRSSLAILAILAATVCGAATISVAMTLPVADATAADPPAAIATAHPTLGAAPTVVPASPVMTPAGGAGPGPRLATPIPTPASKLVEASLQPDLVLLGSWTVEYVVGPANGNGANVTIPLRRLDGLVIRPGATFDFWTAVGEVSRRTGYRRGAIIVGHRIDVDGALAGGICTVSTVLFNAAARAGFQITARTEPQRLSREVPPRARCGGREGRRLPADDGLPE